MVTRNPNNSVSTRSRWSPFFVKSFFFFFHSFRITRPSSSAYQGCHPSGLILAKKPLPRMMLIIQRMILINQQNLFQTWWWMALRTTWFIFSWKDVLGVLRTLIVSRCRVFLLCRQLRSLAEKYELHAVFFAPNNDDSISSLKTIVSHPGFRLTRSWWDV